MARCLTGRFPHPRPVARGGLLVMRALTCFAPDYSRLLGISVVLALIFCLPASGPVSAADDKPGEVKVGEPAPTFESVDDQGRPWKSKDHVGKKILVVYFYPADLTPACTNQACSFRDDMGKL